MAIPGGGGGLLAHGECIEVLALPFDSSQAFVMDGSQPKSPGAWGEVQVAPDALMV